MKVNYIKFREAVRIVGHGSTTHNTYVNSDRLDLELVNYEYFNIFSKAAEPQLLAIVPFSNCAFCYPEGSEGLESLEEAVSKIETGSESDDPTKRFAVPDKKLGNKIKNGADKRAAT